MNIQGAVKQVIVRRFRDSVALHITALNACGEEVHKQAIYVPKTMITLLAETLVKFREDIADCAYANSNLKARVVMENNVFAFADETEEPTE